jgi:uncharacterized protein YjdB
MLKQWTRKVSIVLTFVMMFTLVNGLPPLVPAAHAESQSFYFGGFEELYDAAAPNLGSDQRDLMQPLPNDPLLMQPLTWYKGHYDPDTNQLVGMAHNLQKDTGSSYKKTGKVSLKLIQDKTYGTAASISVSTATYQNISGSFYARTHNSNPLTLYAEWSVDGGQTWNEAATYPSPPLEGIDMRTMTSPHTFTINDSRAEDNENFLFRFRGDKANNSHIYVDDFILSGDSIASKPVTSMELSQSAATIARNETLQLSVASYTPADATGKTVRWSSSDPTIAKVNPFTGFVTPKTHGTVTITATNIRTGIVREAIVDILNKDADVPVSGVTVNHAQAGLVPGQSLQLAATVLPSNATNQTILWSSSDSGVASVDDNGLVTAHTVGSVTITATSTASEQYSASTSITVTRESDEAREILAFGFENPKATGTIDQGNRTITVKVPKGTDLSHLIASYTTPGQSVYVGDVPQVSGQTGNSFVNPVVYEVRGLSDEVTTYTVLIEERQSVTPSRTFYVTNAREVMEASKKAQPGDTLVMKKGVWTDQDIYFSGDGEPDKPITLRAEVQGEVILQGASRVTISGSYLVVDGLTFEGVSERKLDGAVVLDYLSYNSRITNTLIDNFNPTKENYHIKNDLDPLGETMHKHAWIWNYGTYNRIDHNTLIRKNFTGETMRLHRGIVHHARVDHNYFAERAVDDANGTEAIQVGMYLSPAAWDTVPTHSVFENNLFYRWLGEIEIVSVKAHNTIFRYNTLRESRGTVTLRISDNSDVYGNFFLQNDYDNGGAIRAYGDGHKIYNNYISGLDANSSDQRAGISLQAGVSVPGMDTQPATNAIVAYNTIIDSNSYGIVLGASPSADKTVGPDGLILANNIIKGTSSKLIYNRVAPKNAVIEGNIIYGNTTDDLGSGVTQIDPLLVKSGDEEVYRPAENSPAIGAAVAVEGLDFIKEDMDGQARLGLLDVGADQSSEDVIVHRPLTAEDVGPAAASADKELISFSLRGVTGKITSSEINLTVPSDTDVKQLAATFEATGTVVKVGSAAQVSGETMNDFSQPVVYTVTAADGTTADYTVKVQVEREDDSSGSSSGSGSGSGPITAPAPQSTVQEDGSVLIPVAVQSDPSTGTTQATVDADTLNKAFEQAKTNSEGEKIAAIVIPKAAESSTYEAILPAAAFASGSGKETMEVKTPLGTVKLPSHMLNSSEVKQASTVTLSVAIADTTQLSEETRKALAGKPVIDLTLKLDGKTIQWNNPGAKVTVSIPYTLEFADPEHVAVWYLTPDGGKVLIPSGQWDSDSGMVTFSTTHFSLYGVTEQHIQFADLGAHAWAKRQIEVLAAKGIVQGASEKEFVPGAQISRADFVLLLVRTLGLTANVNTNFNDVDRSDYYYEGVGVAKTLGIVEGAGDNLFNPQESISRQDMMVMLDRALNKAGLQHSAANSDLNRFKDNDAVASYAKDSMAVMVGDGLLEGDNGYLYPARGATRAETAVVLYRVLQSKLVGK